ncbi:MAG: SRPBCC family protein [Caulobacteraceae bacterium]
MSEKTTAMKPPPLKISRVFHAPRSTVFKAWTSSEHVKAWFCPETYSVSNAKVESRLGGAFEVCMRSPSGEEHWTRGVFEEIEPDRRLVIASQVENDAGTPIFHARTEVDFSDALGGTRIDLIQTYTFDDPSLAAPMAAGAPEGWRTTLDKLEAEVVRMQGGTGTPARSVVHASFHLERAYHAEKAQVWEALTRPEAKMKWFAGTAGEWELIERAMDVRAGGRERLKGRWKGGVVSTFEAIYHDVVEAERLIYSYEMFLDEKKISVSLASMELASAGAKTLLKVTEQGAFLDGYDDAGSRERGTGLLLDALGASLSD